MGKSGNGQLTKAINNSIYDINCAALAEMLPFAVKLGLEPEQIGKVINTGTAKSGASEFFIPQMLEGKFEYGFTMNQAYKDLVSCNEIAVHEGIPLPVLGATTNVYKMVLLSGYGDLYKGAMICFFENLLDVKFRKEQYKDL
jgi:3-hydroxyisobutyrate dehydrogenase-like beta-hydroxyacid dehydrogenase